MVGWALDALPNIRLVPQVRVRCEGGPGHGSAGCFTGRTEDSSGAFLVDHHTRTSTRLLSAALQDVSLGEPGLRGLGLGDDHVALVQRFDPSAPADTIGFFIAKFIVS